MDVESSLLGFPGKNPQLLRQNLLLQEMTLEEQKILAQKLGILSGKPKEAGLHVHPSVRAKTDVVVHEEAQADPQAFLVSNRLWGVFFGHAKLSPEEAKLE